MNINKKTQKEAGYSKKSLPEKRKKATKENEALFEKKKDNKKFHRKKDEKSDKKDIKTELLAKKEFSKKKTDTKNETRKKEASSSKKASKGKTELGTLKIIPLGGLGEIGKNITAFEYGESIIIIDCGIAFPDEDMPGVDLVIPDFSYLTKNAHKIKGLLITHGHEDHIGAVPYLLSLLDVAVYGTRLSLGIIKGKLDENPPKHRPKLFTVEAGDYINLGDFSAEFIHVNHSIADACAICLRTPVGNIFHSGDFKLDVSPIDGQVMDLTRIGEIGKEGVKLLLCESTNAERPGYTPSERTVGGSLDKIFMQNEQHRLIVATFSSNVHRVQQIINASAKYGRRVAVLGRSMVNVIGAAVKLGYMNVPEGVLIDLQDLKRYRPEETTLITTGSQGEPMSALYRIAFSEHEKIKISSNDVVILSSSAIPGNEKLVGKIVNALVRCGVRVVSDSAEDVHVSGHACREEIKLLISLLRPEYYMPIHGEARHLFANKEIAEFMGISPDKIFISDIGRVLEVDSDGVRFAGSVPSGNILVDGAGVGDIGSVVLRDRRHLAEDGLVVVVISVDMADGIILSGPDIVSRGFVYVKESADLMERTRRVALSAVERTLLAGSYDFSLIKNTMRDDVARFIFKETKRKPMILPIIMDN